MLNSFKKIIGSDFDIEVEYVETTELTRTHKTRLVISDFQADFI
jgi:hypothetical protein